MKPLLSVYLLLVSLNVFSKIDNDNFFNCNLIVEDFLWMSVSEVSNLQYRTFLDDQLEDHSYYDLLPDTALWNKEFDQSDTYVKYYFRHPAYDNYPVVCVTKEKSQKFCEWLTNKINNILEEEHENTVKRIIVRLPTENEWKYAAIGGASQWNEFPWEGNSLRIQEGKHKGQFRLNFKRAKGDLMGIAGNLNDYADVTTLVKSYWPNGYGLYNMCGNVSEIVADSEYAFGGNWNSTGYNVKINSKTIAKASPMTGFRYVIEVIEWRPIKRKKEFHLNKKYFKKSLKPINDTLSMMNYEVSNELYNYFLKSKNHSRPDSLLWNNKFWYSNQYANKYHWHPDFDKYPVVNISIKDVEAFSNWLTEEYFKSTKINAYFRLPKEIEWVLAARGKDNIPSHYPWGGSFIRNTKGSFLCNYRPYLEMYMNHDNSGNIIYNLPPNSDPMLSADLDGYSIVAPVKSYYSNEYGLYNMSGNVAEMIFNADFTKGGSWNSEMNYVQINSKEYQAGPDPKIGFRLIMIKSSE